MRPASGVNMVDGLRRRSAGWGAAAAAAAAVKLFAEGILRCEKGKSVPQESKYTGLHFRRLFFYSRYMMHTLLGDVSRRQTQIQNIFCVHNALECYLMFASPSFSPDFYLLLSALVRLDCSLSAEEMTPSGCTNRGSC